MSNLNRIEKLLSRIESSNPNLLHDEVLYAVPALKSVLDFAEWLAEQCWVKLQGTGTPGKMGIRRQMNRVKEMWDLTVGDMEELDDVGSTHVAHGNLPAPGQEVFGDANNTPEVPVENSKDFESELIALINRHNQENESDTPDFILGLYLLKCLENFNAAVNKRSCWYGEI